MIWIWLALLSSAIWASTNFIDKYLIQEYFVKKTGVLILFSCLIGFIVVPFFFLLDSSVVLVNPFIAGIVILNSFLLIFYLYPYFIALEKNDASTVVPLFQLIPVIGIILGFIFFGEFLTPIQILASAIIIFSSIGISADFGRGLKFGFETFFLMFLSSLMVAFNSVIFKLFSIDLGFFQIAFWQYVGFSLLSIMMLVFIKKYRVDFVFVLKKSGKKIISLNVVNEVINIIAQIIFYSTFTLAPIALIWVFNGFQPFFVLVMGLILTVLFPKIIKENISKQVLYKKIIFIIFLFLGGILLAINV